ncbi:aldehyde oxidase GLOX-like [Magnolia sinica]|uniref:aldehyde oxidase GLOX-like n=1 Tax=Magnolia sinica TaxID=86752 RepID=UPI00265AC038|nr:aldehyde oxidase GLOX-like [Magnolia sinica]
MVMDVYLKCMAILSLLVSWVATGADASGGGRRGTWELLLNSTGVVAMHMALTHANTVIMFDQTRAGRSGYRLSNHHPKGRRRCNPMSTDPSCWAHSIEYRIATNKIRPLTLKTDTWCSSGSFSSNGTLIQSGGYGKGYRRIRYFKPCSNTNCDWRESKAFLSDNRWYASNLLLPDDRVIVVGGRKVFTYEFIPKTSPREGSFELPFLRQTDDRAEGGNNLYPFLHLSSGGNLFIFANRDSILFNYKKGRVVKTFPRMPGEGPRNYPSTGSSVMLPLDHAYGFRKVEIMICGGAVSGAYESAKKRIFLKGLSSCGRMVITRKTPKWLMEEMPGPRLLNDMVILPTGDILIINGAKHGCAGWNVAATPSLKPYLYKPMKRVGKRFSVLKSTHIPRMYHSSAILLPDGRVLVAGSNPQKRYTFSGVEFPTELRLQAFVPYYMGKFFDNKRASNLSILHQSGKMGVRYGEEFSVQFELRRRPSKVVVFHVYAPPFVTHSISMNQRMLKLRCKRMVRREDGEVIAVLVAPPSPNVAPAGYYLLTVVNEGIPSKASWVRFIHA